jgi:MFS family permease
MAATDVELRAGAAPQPRPHGVGRAGAGAVTSTALLRDGLIARVLAWSVLGRLPLGMLPLGLLLLARAGGASYAHSALVAAAYGLGLAIATPLASVAVDRRGYRRALIPRAAAFALAAAILCACGAGHAPVLVLIGLAMTLGIAMPPLTASTRSAWRHLTPGESAHGLAMGLDASLHELVFVCGPAVVAVLAAASPVLVIACVGVAGGLGAVRFSAAVADHDLAASGSVRARVGAGLASRGMRALVAVGALMGASLGLLEASVPAFAEAHGNRALSGVAIASLAAGSALGALVSLRLWGAGSPRRRLVIATALSPIAMALPVAAGSLPAMDALMFIAGLPLAAALAGAYSLVSRVAPEQAQTEAFGWMSTALVAGGAAGTALAGALVSLGGSRLPMVAAAGVALVAAAFVVAMRATFGTAKRTGSLTGSEVCT